MVGLIGELRGRVPLRSGVFERENANLYSHPRWPDDGWLLWGGLSCAPLAGAQFNGMQLEGADLRGADLSGANLGRSDPDSQGKLVPTDLSDADLRDVDLTGAILDYALLVDAMLWDGSDDDNYGTRLDGAGLFLTDFVVPTWSKQPWKVPFGSLRFMMGRLGLLRIRPGHMRSFSFGRLGCSDPSPSSKGLTCRI